MTADLSLADPPVDSVGEPAGDLPGPPAPPSVVRPGRRPRLVHLTTTDMSLDWLLGPQLQAFRRAGYEVIGVSSPGGHAAHLEASGIRHVPLAHATRSMAPTSDARAAVELVGLFRRLRPDIVHTHNPKPGLYGRLAGRFTGAPVVVNTVHGLYALPEDPWTKRAAVYGLERVAASCSDAELVQSPEDVETLLRLRVPRRRVHLLGNGIDLTRFDPATSGPAGRRIRRELGIGDDEVVVGAVGRLVAEKGYRELFAAVSQLRGDAAPVRLVVIGPEDPAKDDAITGDERDRAGREGGVVFLGQRGDMVELYSAMDVFVLASWREGFPRSSMEAAAMGLPIVTTDVRGCRHTVDDGVTGVLVPVRDSATLAAAIGRLVSDPAARARMGGAGRRKAAAEFDHRRVMRITLETYDRELRRVAGTGRRRAATSA